jgi:hypothetical protein
MAEHVLARGKCCTAETHTLKKSCDVRDAGAQLVVAFDLQTLGSSWIQCYINCFHVITIAMIVIILIIIGSNSTDDLQYSTSTTSSLPSAVIASTKLPLPPPP